MARRGLAPVLGGLLDVTAFRGAPARAASRRGPQTIADL
jgi:hypothetical protein